MLRVFYSNKPLWILKFGDLLYGLLDIFRNQYKNVILNCTLTTTFQVPKNMKILFKAFNLNRTNLFYTIIKPNLVYNLG